MASTLPQSLRTEISSIKKDPYTTYPVYGGVGLRPKDDTLLTRGEGKGYDIYRCSFNATPSWMTLSRLTRPTLIEFKQTLVKEIECQLITDIDVDMEN